ncbi:hypothetical protein [Micromonospora sp. NPDC005189]
MDFMSLLRPARTLIVALQTICAVVLAAAAVPINGSRLRAAFTR